MKNIDWFGVFMWCATATPVLFALALVWNVVSINRTVAKYIPLHKCVIVGYAGEAPEPIYQCDTGLKRKRDM